MKQKTCRACSAQFTPRMPMAKACSLPCAQALAVAVREKAEAKAALDERRVTKAKLDAIKTKPQLAKEAQSAFNAWVRLRDHGRPCISCGRMHKGQMQAGHFLSRGAHPELAYEPLNCHSQCAPCNNHLSGNQLNYRKALVHRIGRFDLEWLEGPHPARHYTHDDLRALKAEYAAKARALKAARA